MSDKVGELIKSALTGLASNRVYPGMAPDAPTPPYVVYLYFGDVLNAIEGPATIQRQNVQLDCWAATYLEAAALADLVQDAMLSRSLYASPAAFTATHLMRQYFGKDPDIKTHRVSLEFGMWYWR